jgi:hypothetical protein
MSGADHRENARELRRRVMDESGLHRPVPYVEPEIARLLVDLLSELEATVLELELVRGFGKVERELGLPRVIDVDVERGPPA